MTIVHAGELSFDVDLVVLDKDGTLIDFDRLWAGRTVAAVEALVAAIDRTDNEPELAEDLYKALGYDSTRRSTRADSPLATAPLGTLATVVASALYGRGVTGWHQAQTLAHERFLRALAAPVAPEHIVPIGDLGALLRRWTGGGLRLALATSDNRAGSEATLRQLGLEPLFDALACGDDPLPAKPDPALLRRLGETLAVPIERMLVVGDSIHDLATGRNAGVAGCIGVLSGTANRSALAPLADAVLATVHDIRLGLPP